jgi:hypothetical protein
MPTARIVQNNFTAGELSPRLLARTDFEKYKNGVELLENYLILPHGGVTRRPGSTFVAEVKDSTKKVRLIPFEFNVDQAYICEFGDLYIRFYTLSGQLIDGTPVEVASPYLEAELFELQFAQSADVLYIAHPNHAPRKLQRTSATTFTLTQVDFIDGPYMTQNETATTITPSATTGTGITLTASAALFQSGHVGSLWRIKHSSTWGYAKVTGFTSSTVVTADVKKDFGAATASSEWREGSFSTVQGFPRAVSFYEQRLLWASTNGQPQNIFGSRINDFEDHTPDVNDDDAISFTISGNQVNVTRWMDPGRNLFIGTAGGVVQAKGGKDTTLSPTNPPLTNLESNVGVAAARPIRVGSVLLFIQRSGLKLRELAFSLDLDAFTAPDLTILSEHITNGGLTDIAYQQDPDSTVWAVRADGELLALTYLREERVVGWGRHILGGAFSGGKAVVESVSSIPHEDGDKDQVWVSVKRTINGATKRYVEFLDAKSGFYNDLGMDSGLVYNGAATTTITGLSHLEGETVTILTGGATHPTKVVSGGQITLDRSVTQAEVGLGFTSHGKTLRPEFPQGTIQAQEQASGTRWIRVFETIGLKINGEIIPFREPADPMDQPVPKFTGDVKIDQLGWDRLGQIEFMQDQPLPQTILAILRFHHTGDF